MAVDNISNVRSYTSNGVVVETAGSGKNDVSQTDFLRLMTTQLEHQDPFDPVDGQEMIVQMAQISNSTGIAEMNVTLKAISEQLAEHSELLEALKPTTTDATDTGSTDNGEAGDGADETTTTA